MTEPMIPAVPTQEQINLKLIWLSRQLDVAREELRTAIQEHAEKVRIATRTEAAAFINADGSMDLRKWKARDAAADATFEVGIALANVEASRARVFNLRDQLGATQTLSANIRAEIGLAGSAA
jgi:hypothetical protein